MLKDYLSEKKHLVKLVCGAGNEDVEQVEKLVRLYSDAGFDIFDISANIDVLMAAKRGLEKSVNKDNKYICVSVGIKGDPHIMKADIDRGKCLSCGKCADVCFNNAISGNVVNQKKCIGCGNCERVCSQKAIKMSENDKDLSVVLPDLIKNGIDCIELHVSSLSDSDIFEKWEMINNLFDGVLSICIDRLYLSDYELRKRILKMLSKRKPYTTIIQADGIPMSASNDDYKTTLQAIATASIVQDMNVPAYLFLSGGTNSKTSELAGLCSIKYDGIAYGTYARNLVSEYLNLPFDETLYQKYLSLAKDLVMRGRHD